MKRGNKILFSFLIVLLTTCVLSYEDKESITKRLNFYKRISEYSNNTVSVGVSEEKGLSCIANEFMEYGTPMMKVPKELSLCPYYIFPFKHEIGNILLSVPGMTDILKKDQKFSVYLLTYYLLYYMYAPKDVINTYIKEHKLEDYFKYEEPNEKLKDSFPKIVNLFDILEKEHYDLLSKFSFPLDTGKELEGVFRFVSQKVHKHEHMEMLVTWTSNFEQFKWAYSIVMSRGMTLRPSEYHTLEDTKDSYKNYTKGEKKNHEFNKNSILPEVGAPCVIAFIDLCNHYQPKYNDARDKKPIILDTVKNHFVNTASGFYHPGDELTYTYTNDPSNAILFNHYGFVLPNNIFNLWNVKVSERLPLSLSQFKLCREVGCGDSQNKDSNKAMDNTYNLRITNLDQGLLNFARVRQLKGNIDAQKMAKIFANDNPISFENEVNALLYYYNQVTTRARKEHISLSKAIKQSQKHRNICKSVEEDWSNDTEKVKEWRRNKSFEQIYKMAVSYSKIFNRHKLGSTNNLILNLNSELTNIRSKYLSHN